MHIGHMLPMLGFQTGLFQQLALCCLQLVFSQRTTTLGHFPTILINWKTILPNQVSIELLIQRYYSNCMVFKMHFTINSVSAIWINNLVFRNIYPCVVVDRLLTG